MAPPGNRDSRSGAGAWPTAERGARARAVSVKVRWAPPGCELPAGRCSSYPANYPSRHANTSTPVPTSTPAAPSSSGSVPPPSCSKRSSPTALSSPVPPDDQRRLLQAAGHVYAPDAAARRRLVRASIRAAQGGKGAAGGPGARPDRHPDAAPASRCTPARTSFRRPDSSSARSRTTPSSGEARRAAALLRLQAEVHRRSTISTTSCARRAPSSTSPSAPRLADLRGPGGAAHRRPGEDRLPGRAQAAAGRRAPHRHHALSPRLGGALRARSRTSPSGVTGWRSSGSTCATRRAWRRSAGELLATRDRLDFIINNACQTVRRPPEFYEHMMAGETAALHDMPEPARRLLGAYEGWRGAHLHLDGPGRPRRRPSSGGCRASPGLAHSAELSQVPLLPEERQLAEASLPRRAARPGPAAGGPARSATPGGC